MNRLQIKLIVSIMSISLIGIITVQFFWIQQAIEVKEKHFDQAVNSAMAGVVDRVETFDAARFFTNKLRIELDAKAHQNNLDKFAEVDVLTEINDHDYVITSNANTIVDLEVTDSIFDNIFVIEKADIEELELERVDVRPETTEWTFKLDSLQRNLNTIIRINNGKPDTIQLLSDKVHFNEKELLEMHESIENIHLKAELEDHLEKAREVQRIAEQELKKKQLIERRFKKLGNTVKQIAYEYAYDENTFIDHLKRVNLDEIIEQELALRDIPLAYDYAVVDMRSESMERIHMGRNEKSISDSKYRINLQPSSLRHGGNFLLLDFPNKQAHIFQSIFLLLGGSVLFTLIIILIFTYTVYIIIKQKKLSEIKSDFINNMTHEFKTPIATISLAVDSINNPNVIGNESQVNYYSNIIKEENSRMNAQVENVLQMSLIDKKDLELNLAMHDLHQIIHKSLKNISLHIEKRNGVINTEFLAENNVFEVDEIHFTNVMNNLLDNAIKYSIGSPDITLTTLNTNSGIQIIVEDKGVGMTKDTQSKIFDKFYRVPTGNVHNIKGFGLGLSYVKAIIESFNGSIELYSELDAGSKFSLFLPYKND